jgi:hypothetical protein
MKGNYLFKKVEICGYESAGEAGCDPYLNAELVVMSSTHSIDYKEEFQKVCSMIDACIIEGHIYDDKTVVIPVSIASPGMEEFDMGKLEDECVNAKLKYEVACEEFDRALQLQGTVDIYRNLVHKET